MNVALPIARFLTPILLAFLAGGLLRQGNVNHGAAGYGAALADNGTGSTEEQVMHHKVISVARFRGDWRTVLGGLLLYAAGLMTGYQAGHHV